MEWAKYGNGGNKVKAVLNSFILCVIFHIKAGLGGAVMLHNLGCSPTNDSPHEHCALLHTPGHMVPSPLLQGVAGAGPGARGGAELLTGGAGISIKVAATGEQIILGVAEPPPHHKFWQLARGGGGGEEHLRRVVSVQATGYQDG